jgi:hypothetical protein
VPSELEAKVGYHMDYKNPQPQARVLGSLQQKTTHIAVALGLEWPVGTSTSPSNASEGSRLQGHRAKVAIPILAQ